MRRRYLAVCLLLLSCASAQTVSVQILTDASLPADFGVNYPLGQTRNDAYVYGANFIIGVSYDLPSSSSLTLSLSGSQANYFLAWTVAGSGIDQAMGTALGTAVSGVSGSQSNVYYRQDGTLHLLAGEATRYRIGARATPAATADLNTVITLTLTSN
ncbi:hypothetical protein GCM10008955_24430 [Deinococcus malanensis]|uniref:DUF4402 domain-containing protein n=1 Tax=Deinococcus malanensis TaxID=1706855 RepID=A0ABQ2EX67_9DEIO|nr:hypothetical protein [Deinococcus malanensis]GGK29729.1 hypothetical protein GCM10008955_24430 [Deinococcus malanensis]